MKDNFYITTPIYYPSAKPHMGHAYSSIVADFFARLKRIQGHNVFFLTGTDEHGQKIQRAAEKSNKDPLEFCDEISKTFRNLSSLLNLSNDDFIRTTEKRHASAVTNLWNILEKKEEIYLSKYSGWYSVSDEAFYNEDEIENLDGKKISKSSGSQVEWVEEESYFFKLSKWQEPLLKFYSENPKFILPESRKNEVISFVKSGLKDLSVSRKSFKWGIPVPSNKDHIMYVWLDALTNYLSALNYPNKDDDLFFDVPHMLELFNGIAKLPFKVTWDASNGIIASAATAHPELVHAASDSGCIGMYFGVESGNREILRSVRKPSGIKHYMKIGELMS